MASLWDQIVTALCSTNETYRKETYKQLKPKLLEGINESPTEKQLHRLSDALLQSDDQQQREMLIEVLTWFNTHFHGVLRPEEPIVVAPPVTASSWFWGPLRGRSIAFRAWEINTSRDEDAMFELSRHLPEERFRNLTFQRVPLDNFDWGEVLESDLNAVVFVGRLRLYGESAIEHFHKENWFRFLSDERPPGLDHRSFDPDYHRICTQDESAADEPRHFTHEKNGFRIDYGLVQRYEVDYSGGSTTVIGLWGCSTLGTLAAVRWAIDLAKNTDRLPNADLKPDTPLEALVRVRASTCNSPSPWSPEPVKLVELQIGDERWNSSDKDWEPLPNSTVGWEATSKSGGYIILSGKVRKTHGRIAKIIAYLAGKKLKPGSVIDLKMILTANELTKWQQQIATMGKRIQEYTAGCVVPEGDHGLRVLTPIKKQRRNK